MDELKEQAQMQGKQAAVLIPELLERIKTLEMANEPFVIKVVEDGDGNTILNPELVEAFEAEVLTGKRNKLSYKPSAIVYTLSITSLLVQPGASLVIAGGKDTTETYGVGLTIDHDPEQSLSYTVKFYEL